MGKKFGSNTKAEEGRARKAAQKQIKQHEDEKKKEAREAAEWQVGAKVKSEKQLREEAKKAERAAKKQEKEALEAAEAQEMAKYRAVKSQKEFAAALSFHPQAANIFGSQSSLDLSPSLTISTSSSTLTHSHDSDIVAYTASNINDAITLLETATGSTKNQPLERHPERRVKAAYAAFEAHELPKVREEFPTLRISQLRERLSAAWKKSPDNPMNQPHVSYRSTKSQEALRVEEHLEQTLERFRVSEKKSGNN